MRGPACWISLGVFWGIASTGWGAGLGARIAERVEVLEKKQKLELAKQKELFEGLAKECIEKGVGTVALDALLVLEALDPYNPDWGAMRAKARSLGAPQRTFIGWAKGQFRRHSKGAVKAWRELLEQAKNSGLRSTIRTLATIILTLDPKDKKTHELLGHVKYKREWLPKFDADQARMGLWFDPTWGYVTEEEKEKLMGGQRPRKGKWISVEEDEKNPRTWKEKMIFDGALVRLISNETYDRALSFYFRIRKRLQRMDREFGDFFFPPDDSWPLRVYLCRTQGEMKRVMGNLGITVDPVPVVWLNYHNDTIIARTDEAPWESDEKLTVTDQLMRRLMDWFFEKTVGESSYQESCNAWVMMGMEGLAESRALFETRNVRAFGCFEEYLDLKERGKFKTIKALFDVQYKGGHTNVDETQGAALAHFLLHSDGGRYRAKFLGLVRDFLTENPETNDLPDALKMTAEDIEKSLAAYMKELLGK
ncbi:MAG: hypothetical protein ACYTHM_05770 [Planctomycetota bacterium]|jgi:hypothetical protein